MEREQPIGAAGDILEAGHPDVADVARPSRVVARNTPADTWAWMWKDILTRVAPLTAGALLYAGVTSGGRRSIGLRTPRWRRDIALGAAVGLPMAGLAALHRRWVSPGYKLPTAADQALQTAFYFAINAPAEELFWRATVQSLAIAGLRRLHATAAVAVPLGWALATTAFGAYHRLGGWSWRAIAGVTAAGAVFGLSYLPWRNERSIFLPTLIHGFATAGFLSWGDVALHLWQARTPAIHVGN